MAGVFVAPTPPPQMAAQVCMALGLNEMGSKKIFLRRTIEAEFDKRCTPVECGGVVAGPPGGGNILGSAPVLAMSEQTFKKHLMVDLGFDTMQARGAFNTFNTNQDATIERDEFVLFYMVSRCYCIFVDPIDWSATPLLDQELGRWQIKWLYAIFDVDGNNHMDLSEFRSMIRAMQADKSYPLGDADIDSWLSAIRIPTTDGVALGPRFDEFYQVMTSIIAAGYAFFINHNLNPLLALSPSTTTRRVWPSQLGPGDLRVLYQWKIKSGALMTYKPVGDLGFNKALEDGLSYFNDDPVANVCLYIAKYESAGSDPVVVYVTRAAPFDPFEPFQFEGVWITRRVSVHIVRYDVNPPLIMDTDNQAAPYNGNWGLLAAAGKQPQELKRDAILKFEM